MTEYDPAVCGPIWSVEEIMAVEHVDEVLRTTGRHSYTSCPYPFRAMCSHRLTLQALEKKGWWQHP